MTRCRGLPPRSLPEVKEKRVQRPKPDRKECALIFAVGCVNLKGVAEVLTVLVVEYRAGDHARGVDVGLVLPRLADPMRRDRGRPRREEFEKVDRSELRLVRARMTEHDMTHLVVHTE